MKRKSNTQAMLTELNPHRDAQRIFDKDAGAVQQKKLQYFHQTVSVEMTIHMQKNQPISVCTVIYSN